MKLILRWIGKTKNPHLESLIGDYLARIRHFVDLSLLEIKPIEVQDPVQAVAAEGKRLLSRLDRDDYLVAIDPLGHQLKSEGFAQIITERREHSLKTMVFVLGGPSGLSDAVRKRSHRMISLSSMTFSHEIARLVLLEQIYRAFTLIHHLPYHK